MHKDIASKFIWLAWVATMMQTIASPFVYADTPTAQTIPAADSQMDGKRNFYQVLDDLLGDFEYDLKNGDVLGLKDLSIRNITTSENVPASFKSHLELLITERILKAAKTRVIQCIPCKARKTSLVGDQVVITNPELNSAEMARLAKLTGIQNFMDVVYSFQSMGMVISLYIVNPDTGNVIWSKSYNSETSKIAAHRRGVDYNQLDDIRKETEYSPMIQNRLSLRYLYEPNLPNASSVLALAYRMMERYDNRKKEVGFEAYYMVNPTTMINGSGASSNDLYKAYAFNMTLLFLHGWNFIGEEENYNKLRGGVVLGLGGTYASGYLSGLVRGSYEWRLGKHFGLSTSLGYRPPASAFVNGTQTGTVSGVEFGLGVDFIF